ncbi:uncharacterized protein LOC109724443 [Ananas comosus]|uniref:Uncharacterized protein LOC109724443 n=1 Tax=Ananas comosus TaxID=4615 RepID=A0A6P5GJK0_ANACO|nr:uncharacterized protein LOC109724443 [Ananas comosus]
MAIAVPIPHSFPSTTLNPSLRIHPHTHRNRPPPLPLPLPLPPRASADPGDASGDSSDEPSGDSSAAFERRVSQVRLKYRSGSGKKAEQRRAKKSGSSSPTRKGKGKGKGVLLPPAPLREAVSAGGVPVEVGFSRYSERLNGRVAALGLAALLLVELGSGRSILAYHPAPVLFLQLYSVAAAAALFVKFEKERISIWPQNKPPSSAANSEP